MNLIMLPRRKETGKALINSPYNKLQMSSHVINVKFIIMLSSNPLDIY